MKNSSSKRQGILTFLATLMIPLGPSPQWNHYQFKGIQKNKVEWQNHSLLIHVHQSASPLLYTFKEATPVSKLLVSAHIAPPFPRIPENLTQGERNADDFVLRFGLILKGDDRLSWWQRQLAPAWLIEMEEQLPAQWGIDKVLFFSTCRQKSLLQKERRHFLSDKFEEKCVTLLEKEGDFTIQANFDQAKSVIGLWIGSDGDDLKNKFQLTIRKIEITDNKKSL